MITLLGAVVFATVIAIGLFDWSNGLALFEKPGTANDGIESAPEDPAPSRRDPRF